MALYDVDLMNRKIEMHCSMDLELVTRAEPVVCPCEQHMAYHAFAPRTINKEAASLPTAWRPPNYQEDSIRVIVVSAVKEWQCCCGRQSEQHPTHSSATMQHTAHANHNRHARRRTNHP